MHHFKTIFPLGKVIRSYPGYDASRTYCQRDIFSRGAFIPLHRQYPDRREDRERGKGREGRREHERSRQEKEAQVGWVIRQIQIGVVV